MRKWTLGLDVVAVLVFVAVGRNTHDEEGTIRAIAETALPFLIALVLGWIAARAWQRPWSIGVGIVVVSVTVAAGMVLRRVVFDDGTATSFVLVAAAFLTLFLLGWRIVAAAVTRRTAAAA